MTLIMSLLLIVNDVRLTHLVPSGVGSLLACTERVMKTVKLVPSFSCSLNPCPKVGFNTLSLCVYEVRCCFMSVSSGSSSDNFD